MGARLFRSSAGFTFIALLVIVAIMGIMLAAVGQSWHTIMLREREKELLFRGEQYRQALERWHNPDTKAGMPPASPLNDLHDLLQDPRTVGKNHYLRRLYKDPISGKDFLVLRNAAQGIIGVMSPSEEAPLKTGGFPPELASFEGLDQYKKWVFTINMGQQQAGVRPPVTLPPGSTSPAGSTPASPASGEPQPGSTAPTSP